MTIDERNVLAEWFFRQKVVESGDDWVKLKDGSKILFMPEVDGNLSNALEAKMIELANFNAMTVHFSRDPANTDEKVCVSYFKFTTAMGTTYALNGLGRDLNDARVNGVLKFVMNGTLI